MSQVTGSHLFVDTIDGVTVATLTDASLLAEELIREVEGQLNLLLNGPVKVLLNFREVRFMSSTMLAVLVRFARQVAKSEGRLKLCGLAPQLMEIFRITRFDRVLDIHETEAQALDAF